ncbi:DUF1638 domain-containing protein [Maritimibacter dapengensis]|uniref:DUF1638 domain-containing protein n=1 Tax=Maritimibacter dapengensis TaxID=2836868 RepID=A0ABS6T1W9_9RHOB|nr:DUF1638 domain-containing protein [Maritimibacter dapengensis]MBV7379190.1 DUF1638 domain-containing protein [Maritimibacter dapengensis]
MSLSDEALREEGLAADGNGRVLVIGCGALAREILAIRSTSGLDHVDVTCLPAILHNRPERIAPALEATINACRGRYETIFVAYADCGSGGAIAKICAKHGVEMLDGPHCYSFFEGTAAFSARDEVTAFYLTDFLARQFDAFVTRPLGLDRHPELRDAYFGNYEKLVYLAQTDDPHLDAKARAAAKKLGLAYERRETGYGDLAPAITAL